MLFDVLYTTTKGGNLPPLVVLYLSFSQFVCLGNHVLNFFEHLRKADMWDAHFFAGNINNAARRHTLSIILIKLIFSHLSKQDAPSVSSAVFRVSGDFMAASSTALYSAMLALIIFKLNCFDKSAANLHNTFSLCKYRKNSHIPKNYSVHLLLNTVRNFVSKTKFMYEKKIPVDLDCPLRLTMSLIDS